MDLTRANNTNELMQAQTLLWSHIFNHIGSMSLKCAVELGIPDAIHSHGKPVTVPQLLSLTSIPSPKAPHMRRLMRTLAHLGIFSENSDLNEEVAYSLTPVSSLLVKNLDENQSPFLLAMLHPVIVTPFQSMSGWFRSDETDTPFAVEHGCGVWDLTNRNPMFNKVFNVGVACDTKFLGSVLLKECRHVFEGIESLVDVGGGTGSTARAISEALPGLKCSVLDLPQVVDGVREKGAVDFIKGDMFDYIPPADAVLMKWILHDWNDEECVKILKRCKEAITCNKKDGSKVIIIDQVMGSNSSYQESSTRAQLYSDMLMMVACGGAERGESEWSKLFIDAGFNHYRITPALGLRSIIEVYP